ncbi:zinc finger matrin-type protein 4 isoform X2 [Gopherus flavomarginatus]|uniref:zinc finger matrin-type protein 4 isoform X2 n=1 Tax=Gopherus flavomarginatus TaxID=286002 RepID=UPI0021CBF536|nr:zinc finger matrin-type protein 4 isoform X2 [Gopherus flavomarginatus]
MKSSDIDQELFTESYCKVCSAQLISESQRVAHYESRKHASKVRLYYMLHPIDGGCPAKKLRSENGSDADAVDKNKCCTLCNMSFTSAVVAESHYQGKIHAKRLKLLLGEQPALKATAAHFSSLPTPSRRLSQIRRRKKKTRDEMFSEIMEVTRNERAQLNEWKDVVSNYRKDANEHEDRRDQREDRRDARDERW